MSDANPFLDDSGAPVLDQSAAPPTQQAAPATDSAGNPMESGDIIVSHKQSSANPFMSADGTPKFEAEPPAPTPAPSGNATEGTALEYGLVNGVPFGKRMGAAIGAGESYLPNALQVPGDVSPDIGGADTLSQRFAKNQQMIEAQDVANKSQYPITSFVTPLATAVAALPVAGPTDAMAAGLSRVVPGALADAGAAASVGAGYGAAYGAGDAKSVADMPKAAGEGALMGGIGAGVAQPVAVGIGKLGSAAAKKLGWFGYTPEQQATEQAAKSIAGAQAAGNAAMTPADFATAQAAGQSPVVADLGGESTRRLAKVAANSSPEAAAALVKPVAERFTNQGSDFGQFLKDSFGTDLNNADVKAQLLADAKSTNSPAYRQAYQDGASGVWTTPANAPPGVPSIEDLIQAPALKAGIARANEAAVNDAVLKGNPVLRNPFTVAPNGDVSLRTLPGGGQAIPTLQYWDQVQRALRDAKDVAARQGNNEASMNIGNMRNALLANLDTAVPSFATARKGAFGAFQAQNAFEAGQKFLGLSKNIDINTMKTSLAKMTPAEQKLFSQGLAGEIMQRAQGPDNRNIVNLFNSDAMRDKLQAGLGPQVAGQVEAYMHREAAMTMLKTKLMGNSSTIEQKADMDAHGQGHGIAGFIAGQFGAPIGGAVTGAVGAHELGGDTEDVIKGAAGGFVLGAITKRMSNVNKQVMAELGKQLASHDPTEINKAMATIGRSPKMLEALRQASAGIGYLGAPEPQQRATGGRVMDAAVPEAPATLAAQRQELIDGKRAVLLFKGGKHRIAPPKGCREFRLGEDIVQFDPEKISEKAIRQAARDDTLGQLLKLGPVSKNDAVARIRQGEKPVAVVERDRQGTELRAAAGTHATAPIQIRHFQKTKSNPTNRLSIETPAHVLLHRLRHGVPQ